MKKSWKEMNIKEKLLMLAYIIVGCITAVFAVLDLANLWEHADTCWVFCISVFLVLGGVQKWKDNRKMAFIELGCGVLMLALGIVCLFI